MCCSTFSVQKFELELLTLKFELSFEAIFLQLFVVKKELHLKI